MKKILILFTLLISSIAYADLATIGETNWSDLSEWSGGAVSGGGGNTVSFISSESSTATAGTSITCDTPTGTSSGDLMIAAQIGDNLAELFTPSGWTLIGAVDGGGNFHAEAYGLILTGSPAGSYAFTSSDSGVTSKAASIQTFRKTGGTWITVSSMTFTEDNEETGSSMTTSSITATNGDYLFAAFFNDGGNTVSTAPTGMTVTSVAVAPSAAIAPYYQSVSVGNYTKSITWSGSDQMGAIQVMVGLQ